MAEQLTAALALMTPVAAAVVIALVAPWTLDVPVSSSALPCHIAPFIGGRITDLFTPRKVPNCDT